MSNNECVFCKSDMFPVIGEVFDTRFGIDSFYEISKCSGCGLEITTPRPSSEELKVLYEKYYNFGGEKGTTYTNVRAKFFSSCWYSFWLLIDGDISFHLKKGSGRLLDIGCNEGRGLTIYKNNGFMAEGLELNEKAANEARLKGFVVYSDLVEQFMPVEKYDIVVLSNVLEHSLNPPEMLKHIKGILKPEGQVWISCPNSESLFRKIFGRYWINWHVPFHIVQFSPWTLQQILASTGFGSVDVQQETPALWVAHSLISKLYARPGQVTRQLRNPVLVASLIMLIRTLLFPLLWLANRSGKGDCLVVRATRS